MEYTRKDLGAGLEHVIPEDSSAVREVARCLQYCRAALV